MPQYEVSQEQFDYVREHLDFRLRTGKFSQTFLEELSVAAWLRTVNVFSILDEIAFLEGSGRATSTRKAAPFKGPLLKGLWHKHFMDARFIAKNLANFWGAHERDPLTNDSRHHRRFMDCWSKARKEAKRATGNDEEIESVLPYLSDMLIFQAYNHLSQHGKLTGEWIVYASCDGINHYLTLGVHGEDEAIRNRVEPYIMAHPELKKAIGW